MNNFHGAGRETAFFEGWYLKHQKGKEAVSIIPAFHVDQNGNKSASIQIITKKDAWRVVYPASRFYASPGKFYVRIGRNVFSRQGMYVDITTKGLTLIGMVAYGNFTGLASDIMGPFRHIPFMECNHGVLSMHHTLNGVLVCNGKKLDFNNGTGYIEKDWGTSFPKTYVWSQCLRQSGEPASIMVSAARVPFLGTSFPGGLCAVSYRGREYRFATYRGMKIQIYNKTELLLKQKKYRLHIRLLTRCPKILRAPVKGSMIRRVEESLMCSVQYRLTKGERVIFDFISDTASFEALM